MGDHGVFFFQRMTVFL